MNPKETTEYITLRAAAIMFLEAERRLMNSETYAECEAARPHLDAARSVLWDVINDKDLTKQS